MITLLLAQLGCIHTPTQTVSPVTMPWIATEEQEHPLVGQWWSTTEKRFLTEAEVQQLVRQSHYVLLGEQHDNPDHHSHQAKVAYWATKARPSSVIAFEMLNDPQKVKLADFSNTSRLAISLDWANSGWPSFEYYAPIFDVALAHQSTILAANPSKEDIMGTMTNGMTHPALTTIDVTRPFPENLQSELNQEIIDSHCGYANPEMTEMMSTVQRFKDAWMAHQLLEHGSKNAPAVLIAGSGHTRKDRGVPWYFNETEKKNSLVIAFREVTTEANQAGAYGPSEADILYFTPQVAREDPCIAFQESLEAMHHPQSAPKHKDPEPEMSPSGED